MGPRDEILNKDSPLQYCIQYLVSTRNDGRVDLVLHLIDNLP
jgi:hypothetical protein